MSVSVYHQVIAAAAFRETGVDPDLVDSVTVDDVEVTNLEKAMKKLQKHEQPAGNPVTQSLDKVAGYIGRRFEKKPEIDADIADEIRSMKPAPRLRQTLHEAREALKESRPVRGMKALKDRFDETKAGKTVNRLVLEGDPEDVRYAGRAVVKLKDGTEMHVDVQVHDRMRSAMLQRMSLFAQLVGTFIPMPLVDHAIPALLGAATMVGAQAAKLRGNEAYAQALTETAKKNFVLTLIGPLKYPSMIKDAQDIADLTEEK